MYDLSLWGRSRSDVFTILEESGVGELAARRTRAQ